MVNQRNGEVEVIIPFAALSRGVLAMLLPASKRPPRYQQFESSG